MLQGICRAVEYDSDAQIAYSVAFDGAAGIGWGYARLLSEFDGDGPDQNLVIDMIENPFAVYLDPGTRKWDRRDMRYAFVVQDMTKEAYQAQYGESEVAKAGNSLVEFSGLGDEAQDWFPNGAVRVAEYYFIDEERVEIAEYEIPQSGSVLGLNNAQTQTLDVKKAPKGVEPQNKRTVTRSSVKWCKINGLEILDGNAEKTGGRRIPGKTIPIRPCFGQVLNVNGKRVYRGIVRAARDAQQIYNYQNSELAFELALAPKSKVIMAEGQEEGHEGQWESSNVEAYNYLLYKPTTIGDKVVGPPSVVQFTDPTKIQAIVVAINQAKQDLRSTTGWYDATDPSRKNTDQSGRAILARKESQNQGSINYLDNFNRFVTSLGKLMLEWIPEIYDREGRIVRVLGMEDEIDRVMVNAPFVDGQDGVPQKLDENAAKLMQGVKSFMLGQGMYGVRVSPGTSYTTRKQEAAEWQFRILEAQPEMMGVFGDIAFKNLDGPGHEQIAKRIANTIPPQIKGDENQQNDPAALQAQLAQAQQVLQGMQAELAEKTRLVETDGIKAQAQGQIKAYEVQAKEREQSADNATKLHIERLKAEVAAMQVRAELLKVQATLDAEMAKTAIQEETKRLLKHADLQVTREMGDRESFENDQDRTVEREMADRSSMENERDRDVTRETAARKETVN